MNGNDSCKEWRGVKTTGNVFIYNYILCNFFFIDQVVSHFWLKIYFQKFKVLQLKTVNSFLQNLPLIFLLDDERCTLSNAIALLQNFESRNALPT